MTSQKVPSTFESESYLDIVEEIMLYGFTKFGESGYDRIVFTNGCFDILHPGHLKLLAECRALAGPKGAVVVGVNSDDSVRKLKGNKRPFNNEQFRCMLLVHMKSVDHVVSFSEETPMNLIQSLIPDIIVKGSDYKNSEVVGSSICPVVFVDLEQTYSTTEIAKRIAQNV